MKQLDLLHFAALLHDIGKFRRCATTDYGKTHQEHSYEFVTEDFAEFFAPCGDTFKNAIRHHHPDADETQLESLVQRQVILADRLSATESKDEDTEPSALVSILSKIEGADKKHHYKPTALSFDQDTIIPTESADVDTNAYTGLWKEFTDAFRKATEGKQYTPADYQTIVALLHKYTSRMPSETANPAEADISLYDHLRTTAAIAACLGRELTDTDHIDALLANWKESDRTICALIKGDISGIQNFLYHILSDRASNQLRGRSFYLQLLTEAIAHWVLRKLELPITNLILASGGHFFILAPYTEAEGCMPALRQKISQQLWALHKGELSCILDYVPVAACDFEADKFSKKWGEVSEQVHQNKQKKWAELGEEDMFQNLFKPHENRKLDEQEDDEQEAEKTDLWKFIELGKKLRKPKYLITFDVPESPIPEKPIWHDTIKAFGMEVRLYEDRDEKSTPPENAEHVTVYRIGNTNFLEDIKKYEWEDLSVSYDFRLFHPVVGFKNDDKIADYNNLADASEGVEWFGALRMDVDNLGDVFINKFRNAGISRLATLSEALRLFFEGYVPQLCREYNQNQKLQILELIYAGGDDLFLVGGWSALPDIATQIRAKFRQFVTGDHITLSGGIAIEHKKFPLYQFADISGDAENGAKSLRRENDDGTVTEKDAIAFLRKPMSWDDFKVVTDWHRQFLSALKGDRALPRDILTRLSQLYSAQELKGWRWAWRSIYYFHRLQERNDDKHKSFINKLKGELNHNDAFDLKEFIQVITRWTALRIRK